MLELDCLLEDFVTHRFADLGETAQGDFEALLEQEDQILFGWLMGNKIPWDERFATIVKQILATPPV